MPPNIAVDISDEGHYPLADPRFLSLNFWLALGDDFTDPFQFRSKYPPTLLPLDTPQLFIFHGRSLSPDKIFGSYTQYTGMNCLLRVEKLLDSSLLPNYEERMAKSYSPELRPTNIFPKCDWFLVQLIITTYIASLLCKLIDCLEEVIFLLKKKLY